MGSEYFDAAWSVPFQENNFFNSLTTLASTFEYISLDWLDVSRLSDCYSSDTDFHLRVSRIGLNTPSLDYKAL